MIELRWLEREITVSGDSFNGEEIRPIKNKIRILQQKTKYANGFTEWRNVPTVKEGEA